MKAEMVLGTVTFGTYHEAEAARREFSVCAAGCQDGLKIQAVGGAYVVQCMRHPAHALGGLRRAG